MTDDTHTCLCVGLRCDTETNVATYFAHLEKCISQSSICKKTNKKREIDAAPHKIYVVDDTLTSINSTLLIPK